MVPSTIETMVHITASPADMVSKAVVIPCKIINL